MRGMSVKLYARLAVFSIVPYAFGREQSTQADSPAESLRATALHLNASHDTPGAGDLWTAFELPMINGTNTTGQGLYQLRVANATDFMALQYCIDCRSCQGGGIPEVTRCLTNFSFGSDIRSQVWLIKHDPHTMANHTVAYEARDSRLCLSTNADGRLEVALQRCNTSDVGQHWGQMDAQSPSTFSHGQVVESRQLAGHRLSGSFLDTTGCSGGYLLWPKPQFVALLNKTTAEVGINSDFKFVVSPNLVSGIIKRAIDRYSAHIFHNATASHVLPQLLELQIVCDGKPVDCGDDAPLTETSDESYILRVILPNSGTSSLHAQSVWGLLRGLETFSQMVERRPSVTGGNTERSLRAVPVEVRDAPRFGYRGLLLDTARHYFPLSTIRQQIDALSWSKMNVLHWHAYDSSYFSLKSSSIPALAKAAIAPNWQYSHEDISGVVQYAKDRGVRIIVEFDTPSHANSLYKAIPAMGAICYDDYLQRAPLQAEVNPCADATYDTLKKLLTEFAPLFNDTVVHLGGDEADYGCWIQDPKVQLGCRGGSANETYSDLEQRYYEQIHDILKELQKRPMHWHDSVTERNVNLSSDALVEVWDGNNPSALATVLARNYEAVYAGSFYLDHRGDDWDIFYSVDPTQWKEFQDLPMKARAGLMGLEACMWGENIDHTNAISTTWPRCAAVAERAWSTSNATLPVDWSKGNIAALNSGYVRGPKKAPWQPITPSSGHQSPSHVLERMHAHRCRLLERGLNAAPLVFGNSVGTGWIFGRGGLCPHESTPPP